MSGVNKAFIIGRLGRDPELRYTPDGTAIANFTVATSEEWKDKTTGEKKQRTEWHRIVAYRKLGEICGEYLAKGRQVYVEGRIQTREWEDKEGVKRHTTEIIATDVQFLGTKDSAGPVETRRPMGGGDVGAGAYRPSGGYESAVPKTDMISGPPDDDIPF